MQQRPLPFIICMAAAFVAGAVSHAVFQKPVSEKQATPPPALPQKTGPTAATPSAPPPPATRHDPAPAQAPAPPQGSLVHRTEVVDAIHAGGGERKLFERLGLTEQDRAQVTKVRNERMTAFRNLEASHAKVVSDPQGSHVEIAPFPDERGEWLKGMEEDLRKQLGDDRAAVVARMIAFSDNDEEIGLFRREIFVTPPGEPGGKFKIEEKTFDANGDHMDSDYELIDDRSKSRWGHLLDFEDGN